MIVERLYPMIAEWTPDRVKAVRKALGQTQEQFAANFRLHPEAVRTWEQSRGKPSGPATVILESLERQANIKPPKPKKQMASAS